MKSLYYYFYRNYYLKITFTLHCRFSFKNYNFFLFFSFFPRQTSILNWPWDLNMVTLSNYCHWPNLITLTKINQATLPIPSGNPNSITISSSKKPNISRRKVDKIFKIVGILNIMHKSLVRIHDFISACKGHQRKKRYMIPYQAPRLVIAWFVRTQLIRCTRSRLSFIAP